jgi:hypothetical protein
VYKFRHASHKTNSSAGICRTERGAATPAAVSEGRATFGTADFLAFVHSPGSWNNAVVSQTGSFAVLR